MKTVIRGIDDKETQYIGGKYMKENKLMNWRRRLSGFLAVIMVATLILSDVNAVFAAEASERFLREGEQLTDLGAYSKATLSNAVFKNNREDMLGVSVFSSPDSDFRAGGTVYLDVHLKNETSGMITDGTLSYKAKGVEEEYTYFEEPWEDAVVNGDFDGTEEEEEINGSEAIELINDLDGETDDSLLVEDEYRGHVYEAGLTRESEEREEENEEEEDGDEDGLLKELEGITLAPGEIYTAHFVYVIDEDVADIKNQHVKFKFKGTGEGDQKRIDQEEIFRYTVNYINMDSVEFEHGNRVATGEEVTMGIHTSLYNFDGVLEDTWVDMEETATSSDASSATPSDAETATPSDGEEATPSDMTEPDEDTFVVDLGKSTYKIEMTNAKLNGFQVRKALVSDAYENMLICTFRVSKDVKPGVYFGKIQQETRAGARTCHSNQGFALIVTGDGQVTLSAESGGGEVIVSGPVTSFPEADQLAVSVTEIDPEQQALVDQALEKKAQEEGVEVTSLKALDIKIYADGVETEPTGPIQVAFKNVELEQKQPKVMEAVASLFSLEEETVTKVFHLDEEAVEINEMTSVVKEDGTVVMDTDHFSIYIVVNVPDVKEITVTVEHYAMMDQWKIVNGKLAEPTEGGKLGNRMYPGAKNGKGEYDKKLTEIYSPDTVKLPSGTGTGVGYSVAVETWSKVAAAGNYKVKSVTVIRNKKETTYTENGTEQKIDLKNGDKIRINYVPTTGIMEEYTGFHDYNVSIKGNDGVHKNLNTNRVGINNWNLERNTNRIGVGIYGDGSANILHNYDNPSNNPPGNIKKGIAKDTLSNGNIRFNYADPGLFNPQDVITKETYNGKQKVDYYAKKYLPNYRLSFDRKGDTYTLSSVKDSSGNLLIKDLDKLRCTHEKPLYSNLFWPLDTVSYGTELKTRDPLFGNNYNFPQNDESSTKKHNWFFGMRYDFSFVLGDYVGPLNYYFRGDDDFWLFIDGKLVKTVDLGGIHSAEGAYVDLTGYFKGQDKNKEHRMTVYYMERGGYGSCCYMSFTLPNIKAIPTPDSETTEYSVTKKWLDGNNKDGVRPPFVYAQLYQDGKAYGAAVRLDESKQWKHTWTDLPKYKNVNNNTEHQYTVKEVGEQTGYESSVSGSTITNTQLTEVSIQKKWSGMEGASVKVRLYREDGTPVGDLVELNPSNNWKTVWKNLKKYDPSDREIKYIPYEVDADGNKIEEGTAVSDGKYIVSYNEDHSTVTNTYNYKTVTVKKVWDDHENAYQTRPISIKVQLYQNGQPFKAPVVLDQGNEWKHTWNDLPQKENGTSTDFYTYIVKELNENGTPMEHGTNGIVGETENGSRYEYTVTYGENLGTEKDPLLITNKLCTAKLRLKKEIVDSSGLPNEPMDDSYKFLIHVKDLAGQIYTTASLGHEELSGTIVVIPPASGEQFTIEEIVPMEYVMTGMEADQEGKLDGSENGSKVTVLPGDDITITVKNVPAHDGYFHHTASVTNEKSFDHGSGGDFKPENDYKEPHGKDSSSAASKVASAREYFVAIVDGKEKEIADQILERGDDLCG